ncbi:MAG TPA: hypothetical protein VJN88_04925 [Ktedonobacterales bacterium]|nr:hypothetical protein [Ktedonobacterales bacterium]
MIATGLLWYDDDTRRPLAVKIADAAQRFRERIGYEPTTCQLNPALAEKAANDRPKRGARRSAATPPAPELAVRIEPSESLRPNYFFVGVQAGDKLKRVRGWQSPDLIGDERRGRTMRAHAPTPRKPGGATARTSAAPPSVAPSAPAQVAVPGVQPVAPRNAPVARPAVTPDSAKLSKTLSVTTPAPKTARGVAKVAKAVTSTPTTKRPASPVAPAAPVVTPASRARAQANTPAAAAPAATGVAKAPAPAPVAAKPTKPSRVAAQVANVAAKPAKPAAIAVVSVPSPKKSAPARSAASASKGAKTQKPATPATVPPPSASSAGLPAAPAKSAAPRSRPGAAPRSAAPKLTAPVRKEPAAQTSLWGDAIPPAPATRRRKTA